MDPKFPEQRFFYVGEDTPEVAAQWLREKDDEAVHAMGQNLEGARMLIEKAKIEELRDGTTAQFPNVNPDELTPYDLWLYKRIKLGEFEGSRGISDFQQISHELRAKIHTVSDMDAGVRKSRLYFLAYLNNLLLIEHHKKGIEL